MRDEFLVICARGGDELAAALLVKRHFDLVRFAVDAYFVPGAEHQDLLQEGRIGAYKAIRDYRPHHGAPFRDFARLCIRRQVITAVKTATRAKHGPLTSSVRVDALADGEQVDSLDRAAVDHRDPPAILAAREDLAWLSRALRERLSDLECACAIGVLNGRSYAEIGADWGLKRGQVDRAITRARWKLREQGPPSVPRFAESRRNGKHGYACPSCGGPTVKAPGPGRPPNCTVCRMRPAAA